MPGPHFAIPQLSFNFYAFFLASAIFAGEIYLLFKLKSVPKTGRILFVLLSTLFTMASILLSVLLLHDIVSSSLCGAIGFMACALLFDKLYNNPKAYKLLAIPQPSNAPKYYFSKHSIIAAPLIYAIAKLGCTYAGCCHGFAYSGPFSLIYDKPEAQGEFFPVQPLETLVFFGIFFFAHKYQKPTAIIATCAAAKFCLDFLRYTHETSIISSNQILCLGALIVLIAYKSYTTKRKC